MLSLICWKQLSKKFKFTCGIANITLKNTNLIKFCSTKSKGNGTKKLNTTHSKSLKSEESLDPPEEPTTCCMSGCANCVWLDYAEKLCEYYQDGGDQAIREINERISDPNIKAYILHEIRMRNKK